MELSDKSVSLWGKIKSFLFLLLSVSQKDQIWRYASKKENTAVSMKTLSQLNMMNMTILQRIIQSHLLFSFHEIHLLVLLSVSPGGPALHSRPENHSRTFQSSWQQAQKQIHQHCGMWVSCIKLIMMATVGESSFHVLITHLKPFNNSPTYVSSCVKTTTAEWSYEPWQGKTPNIQITSTPTMWM